MNFSALKARTLQHIAFLTGAPTAGTKASIISDLQASLHQPRLAKNATRILSVDMGIRNLAYCVIDVPPQTPSPKTKTTLHATQWKRLDLLSRLSSSSSSPDLPSTAPEPPRSKLTTAAATAAHPKPSFTPSTMSRAALTVALDLLAHNPDTILIERQRFRSNGSSAIQEWTVRVNMLESMLWACFETLKATRSRDEGRAFPELHECSPKRVAGFWAARPEAQGVSGGLLGEEFGLLEDGAGVDAGGRKAKKAAEVKKEKIAVLRSWLDGSGGVELVLEGETEVTAKAFAPGVRRRGSKALKEGEVVASQETKLDDLADCMLQGAAWVRWEENRRAILRAFQEQSGER